MKIDHWVLIHESNSELFLQFENFKSYNNLESVILIRNRNKHAVIDIVKPEYLTHLISFLKKEESKFEICKRVSEIAIGELFDSKPSYAINCLTFNEFINNSQILPSVLVLNIHQFLSKLNWHTLEKLTCDSIHANERDHLFKFSNSKFSDLMKVSYVSEWIAEFALIRIEHDLHSKLADIDYIFFRYKFGVLRLVTTFNQVIFNYKLVQCIAKRRQYIQFADLCLWKCLNLNEVYDIVNFIKVEMAEDPLELLAIQYLINVFKKQPIDLNLACIMQYDFLQPHLLNETPDVLTNKATGRIAINGLLGSLDWTICSVQLCWYLHLITIHDLELMNDCEIEHLVDQNAIIALFYARFIERNV
eukprot:NODE_97_length_20652_cov_0.832093.p6 type:complete len:361 gc:universal NODE_97_length_20652_cov_0.832093:18476-19558(+)